MERRLGERRALTLRPEGRPFAQPPAQRAPGAPRSRSGERTVLGRTGLEAYRLGFGGIPIQRVSEEQAVDTVRHALEAGLDFIDTARGYTTSERRIGLALKEVSAAAARTPAPSGRRPGEPADGAAATAAGGGPATGSDADAGPSTRRVIIASKSPAKQGAQARADLETSLTELQLDHIDLYQCHFVANQADYQTVTSPGGALEALRRAQDEGLVDHVGITSHSLDVLDGAVDDGLFDTIMVCFSFLEPQARERVIPKAIDKNIGVIAMKPFSGGVIEDAPLALRYVLAQPGILVLAGVESPDLFAEDWRVFQEGAPLTEAERRRIAALQQSHDKVFCRRCDYCQPCPQGIPIQMVLGLTSMVKRLGEEGVRKGPYWAGISKGYDCLECGDCMARCPYQLPIPDLIRENLQWLDEESGMRGD